MTTRYTSNAEWPNAIFARFTSDTHATEEQAAAVCEILRREGLGGERKVFPVIAWVEKKTEP